MKLAGFTREERCQYTVSHVENGKRLREDAILDNDHDCDDNGCPYCGEPATFYEFGYWFCRRHWEQARRNDVEMKTEMELALRKMRK